MKFGTTDKGGLEAGTYTATLMKVTGVRAPSYDDPTAYVPALSFTWVVLDEDGEEVGRQFDLVNLPPEGKDIHVRSKLWQRVNALAGGELKVGETEIALVDTYGETDAEPAPPEEWPTFEELGKKMADPYELDLRANGATVVGLPAVIQLEEAKGGRMKVVNVMPLPVVPKKTRARKK